MESNENAQNTNVDELLKETEIGSFIAKNKASVISGVVFLLLLVITYGFYTTHLEKLTAVASGNAYKFTQSAYKSLESGALTSGKYLSQLETELKNNDYHEAFIPVLFKSFDYLYKNKDLETAAKVIELVSKNYKHKNSYLDYFILVRQASLLEDEKKYKEAISTLNKITSLSVKVMEAKTYLDLGRLYILVGNKEKAKTSLFYVIDNFAQEDFAKVARIYLAKIQ
jgi:predicted negative regulator of RcsB-dependent stress response